MSKFHELRVSSIDRETAEAVSIGFDVPAGLRTEFSYKAGQYLTLEKEIAGTKFRRSYSICTSPESDELKVAVKQIADGRFSTWVNKKLKVGDTLNVFVPEGRFIFEPSCTNGPRTLMAFAAGSGITPVMSILQSMLVSEPESKFILVYGNKTPEQTIFYEDLLKLQEKHPDRLQIEYVYSRLKKEKAGVGLLKRTLFGKKKQEPKTEVEERHYGRIDQDLVSYLLKEKYASSDISNFYLCGPETMIQMTADLLKADGVPEHQIHYELFVTKDDKKASAAKAGTGKTMVTIILDEEETTFEMDRRSRVLDAAMDEGLDPPYSCQGGICSSCIAQVVEGEAEMVNNMILTEGEIAEGLILTCQAHPKTDKLIVDYDDV